MMLAAIFLALLGIVQPATTAVHVAPVPVVKPDVVVDGSKLVCRREVVIGSNVPGKRVCKSKNQLLAEQAVCRDAAKEMTTPSGASSNN